MAKVFLYISSFHSSKNFILPKRRDRRFHLDECGAAKGSANTPGTDSCQLGQELGFSIFYYCGFIGWAAGCLIMIKTIIILHNYIQSFARTWI